MAINKGFLRRRRQAAIASANLRIKILRKKNRVIEVSMAGSTVKVLSRPDNTIGFPNGAMRKERFDLEAWEPSMGSDWDASESYDRILGLRDDMIYTVLYMNIEYDGFVGLVRLDSGRVSGEWRIP